MREQAVEINGERYLLARERDVKVRERAIKAVLEQVTVMSRLALALATALAAKHKPRAKTATDRLRVSLVEHPDWTFAQHARAVGVSRQFAQGIGAAAGYASPRAHKRARHAAARTHTTEQADG